MSGPGARLNAVRLGLLSAFSSMSDSRTGVFDSELAGRQPKARSLIVATAIETSHGPPERAASRYSETYVITCHALMVSGSKAAAGRWQDMADVMDDIEAAILADQSLGGVVYDCYLGEAVYNTESDTEGADAQVDFAIIAHRDG